MQPLSTPFLLWMAREPDDLQSGAIRKGMVEPGEGDAFPCDGDLVGCLITTVKIQIFYLV
jgi:hypothetical protein